MATWTALTYSYGSLLTSTKMTQNQDNFTALAEKASDAPVLANGYVVEAMLGASAVAQAKLKTTTGEVSTTAVHGLLTLAGGEYGFYAQTKQTSPADVHQFAVMVSQFDANGSVIGGQTISSSYTSYIAMGTQDSSRVMYAQQRYVQSSPPWESYRVGEAIPIFVFGLLDKTTGKIVSTYTAEDPPWGNNGPTITNPLGRLRQLAKSRLPGQWDTVKSDPVKRAEYISALANLRAFMEDKTNARAIAAELARTFTQEEKNADMVLISHPFAAFDPAKFAAVVINPMDDAFCAGLHCRHTLIGDSIGEVLHDDYLVIDNSPISELVTPSGVMAVRARWKLT